MEIIKLYADLLANPRNLVAYKDLIKKYKELNLENEFKAIEELIQRKFNADSSHSNKEQLQDNKKDS